MYAVSLYISACRLMVSSTPSDQSSLEDLCKLVPYLHQSLSCTVCGKLLKQPYAPKSGCEHHVCQNCLGGEKQLDPPCHSCEDYNEYIKDVSFRILVKCYKRMCQFFMVSDYYLRCLKGKESIDIDDETLSITELLHCLHEAAAHKDGYSENEEHPNAAFNTIPMPFASASLIPKPSTSQDSSASESEICGAGADSPNTSNGPLEYSVMYTGSGNKITIKRKAVDDTTEDLDSPPSKEIKVYYFVYYVFTSFNNYFM